MASPFILIKCNLELLLSTCCPLASWTKGTSEVCPFAFRWSRPEGTLGVATPAMDLKEAPTLASKAANSDRIWWFGVSNMSRLLFSTCFHQLAAPDLKFIAWKTKAPNCFGNCAWHHGKGTHSDTPSQQHPAAGRACGQDGQESSECWATGC